MMARQLRRSWRYCLVASACALLAACGPSNTKQRAGKAPIAAQDKIAAKPVHPALTGTIAEFAALAPSCAQPTRVEGYGVVANLPNTGSADMPPQVRQLLVEQLYQEGVGSPMNGTANISPEDILSTRQIGAVTVWGYIPAMASEGTTFDLHISALPGTQTTSLAYGVLWTTDLRQIGLIDRGPTSSLIAKGRGPVFCNPYTNVDDPTAVKTNVREGRVMSGGIVLEDAPIYLQLYTPSYRITTLMQRVLNARFVYRPQTCNALSDSLVQLHLPPGYHDHPQEFVDLVTHMFLAQDVPGFTDRKTLELITALQKPDAPKMEISQALEGLGRPVLAQLRDQYTSADPAVRYYAARAGAALQDVEALAVLQTIALTEGDPYQYQSVSTVARYGELDRATGVLLSVMRSNNQRLRIAAYEGLVALKSPELHSYPVGRKFILDRVVCAGDPVIYATSSGEPRIALIGPEFELPTGMLYVSNDNYLTVSVEDQATAEAETEALKPKVEPAEGDRNKITRPVVKQAVEPVVLYYRGMMGDKAIKLRSRPFLSNVVAVLGDTPDPRNNHYNPTTPYIGLSYQRIVEMLASLTKQNLVAATFMMQQPQDNTPNLAQYAGGELRPDSDKQSAKTQ
jgi:hypothetical protein